MSHHTDWADPRHTSPHCLQQSFLIHRPGPAIPGTVWTPSVRSGPRPLVLLGHGGSGHRHSRRVVAIAGRLVEAGYVAAAIDGPYHGDRVPSPLAVAAYQARIVAEGVERVLDRMAEDWVATRDVLVDAGIADRDGGLAYFGLSMATRFGLAAAVALAPELSCAVLGKFGTRSVGLDPGLHAPARALRDAAGITVPVFFHVQWDDEVFPREGQLELFDAFPSAAKELHAFPGGHAHTPEHAPDLWCAFIDRHNKT